MHKVIIIGCPGSGKSYFARLLRDKTKLPLYYLDQLHWNPDRTTVEEDIFLNSLNEILNKDEWIIDGNYKSTMELRMEYCDTIFFLDFDTETCLNGALERRGTKREDLPWIEDKNDIDEEFLDVIKNYNKIQRPRVLELLDKYNKKDIHIFKNRDEANEYLNSF